MQSLTRINLKLLQTFLLVAEHSSFRQAAEETHRSQSAVSTQIRQLEDQLGVALFHRTTRRVRLTPEGEQLLTSARRALFEVEIGLRSIRKAVDMRRGKISLLCSPTIAMTKLPATLAAFEHDFPGITVFVREVTSEQLLQTLREGEVDFGIGPVSSSSDFSYEPILDDPLYAVVPLAMVKSRKERTIDLAELAELPLLLLDQATALRSLLEDAMRGRHLVMKTRYQFSQAHTLLAMAEAGLGAAVLPKVVIPERTDLAVRVLRIEPTLYRQIAIITLRGHVLSPAAARLAQHLRQTVREGSEPVPMRRR